MTIYLARHGQTEENLIRIFQGHLPGTLTEEGRRQALCLGGLLENIDLDAVVSSDLCRVTETVRLAVGGRNLPWQTTPLLREIDWGSWTGKFVSSVDLTAPPADVETREMLFARAARCLDMLRSDYAGKRVLVVAHGQLNRSLEANIRGIKLGDLATVSVMKNAELRVFYL